MPLRVQDLTFLCHPLAKGMDNMPPDLIEQMPFNGAFMSAKQAVVHFANGWSMSFVTHTPDGPVGQRLMLFKGDERIPTYEIAVFDPEGNMGDPYCHMTVTQSNQLICETMSQDYVGLTDK